VAGAGRLNSRRNLTIRPAVLLLLESIQSGTHIQLAWSSLMVYKRVLIHKAQRKIGQGRVPFALRLTPLRVDVFNRSRLVSMVLFGPGVLRLMDKRTATRY
jgi:hypothetical protein